MIEIDISTVTQNAVGYEEGLDLDFEFANYSKIMSDIISAVYSMEEVSNWFKDGYQEKFFHDVKRYANAMKGRFKDIIVFGTGSPIEAVRALVESLIHPYWNILSPEQRNNAPRIHFFSEMDPELSMQFGDILLEREDVLYIALSRKGEEFETMALMMAVKEYFEKALGPKYRGHIVTCTEKHSLLYQISKQEGYKCFEIPYERAGNYAILSTCGLLSLILLGIDIDEVLAGVASIIKASQDRDIRNNKVAQLALVCYLAVKEKQTKMAILMSYSARLKQMIHWCSRYKVEMLSKDYDQSGKYIASHIMPFCVHGFNDQNVLLQVLLGGENNKIVNIFQVKEYLADIPVPHEFGYTAIGYLGGSSLGKLLHAEIDAMRMILTDNHIPSTMITIPKITPYYIGQFITVHVMNTVIQACLSNINLIEEPHYEDLKNYIWALMGKAGYEETLREFNEKVARIKQQ